MTFRILLFTISALLYSSISHSFQCHELFSGQKVQTFPKGWVLNDEISKQAMTSIRTKEQTKTLKEAIEEYERLNEDNFHQMGLLLAEARPPLPFQTLRKSHSITDLLAKILPPSSDKEKIYAASAAKEFPLQFWHKHINSERAPNDLEFTRYVQLKTYFREIDISNESFLFLVSGLLKVEIPQKVEFDFDMLIDDKIHEDIISEKLDTVTEKFIKLFKQAQMTLPNLSTLMQKSQAISRISEYAYQQSVNILSAREANSSSGNLSIRDIKKMAEKNIAKNHNWNVLGKFLLQNYIRDALFILEKKSGDKTNIESDYVEYLEHDLKFRYPEGFFFLYSYFKFISRNDNVPQNTAKIKSMIIDSLKARAKKIRAQLKDENQNTEIIVDTPQALETPSYSLASGYAPHELYEPGAESKKRKNQLTDIADSKFIQQPKIEIEKNQQDHLPLLHEFNEADHNADMTYRIKEFDRNLNNLSGSQNIKIAPSLLKELKQKNQSIEEWIKAFTKGKARFSGQAGVKHMLIRIRDMDWWEIKITSSDWRILMIREKDGTWNWVHLENHKNIDRYMINYK